MTSTTESSPADAAPATRCEEGLLLLNLGSPAAPTTAAVRTYLAEFLSDPYVIDIAPWLRTLLLYGVILPFRSPKSAAAYASIWTEEGSPLLVNGRALERGVAAELPGTAVALGMRYGEPSIRSALGALRARGVRRLCVLPLYPQEAASSSGSSRERVRRDLSEMGWGPELSFVPAFFDDPGFLDAFAERARGLVDEVRPDRVLFSFHGLPERHVRKADPTGTCLESPDCCARLEARNADCYRAQSFATARALAERLGLDDGAWETGFQSRLGRTPWIRPYSDELLDHWARSGVKRCLVLCPAFVADCLETLEEVGMRYRERFLELGGEELVLVPSLNAEPAWVRAVAALGRRALGAGTAP